LKLSEIKVCIIRVEGTNCDAETQRAFFDLGVQSHVTNLKKLVSDRNLMEYDVLVIPGGFSYGDHVRAGAILAKRLFSKLRNEIELFIKNKKIILGICNGFQTLIESGLLPEFQSKFSSKKYFPKAALATNYPIGFKCRWIYLKHINNGSCIPSKKISKNQILKMPIAHGEGRFILSKKSEKKILNELLENDQIVFRYSNFKGNFADGKYPENPNGSIYDIAGICNLDGTILGLMPHPERAYFSWQLPNANKNKLKCYGDGKLIFKSIINYIKKVN
jgi:phosphoribosylformylglycinamidine synthase